MGNYTSHAPIIYNTCNDEGDPVSQDVQIQSFCTPSVGDSTSTITGFCSQYGGTYPLGNSGPFITGAQSYPEPEWGFSGSDGNCNYDDCHSGWAANGGLAGGGGCSGLCCAIIGINGSCTRKANLGDPLMCCLRDYQCSGNTNPTNKFCFSDDNNNSTCPADFRATDTIGCQYLTTQMCLGNIPEAFGPGNTGFTDFTQLWTDSVNPNGGVPWTVSGTPVNTVYRTSQDITNSSNCTYDANGALNGGNRNGGSCPTHTWALNSPGAPTQYFPISTPYNFGDSLPPCQQIFWRTLYGNQPQFKNNFYAPAGTQGDISANTSILPQAAACGKIPFDGVPTPVGTANATELLEAAVKKYIANGGNLIAPIATTVDAPFRDWLKSVCSEYPALCQNILKTTCAKVTPDTFKFNPEALNWCGCYMDTQSNQNAYAAYTEFSISKECTPYCNAVDVIPSIDDIGNIKTCNQSVCMIDNVALNLAKSKVVGGAITFNQICTSCSAAGGNGTNTNTSSSNGGEQVITNNVTSSCQCIMNNLNLTTIGATISGGINISEACNGNAKCYNTQTLDGIQQSVEVDCHNGSISGNNVAKEEQAKLMTKAKKTSNLWVVFIFGITFLIVILAWILISPIGPSEKDVYFSKTTNIQEPTIPSTNNYYYAPAINYGASGYSKQKFF